MMSLKASLTFILTLFLGITSAKAAMRCENIFSNSASYHRTKHLLERQMVEKIAATGINRWLKLQENPKFNLLIGAVSIYGISKGAPPLFLPDIHYKISPKDLETLILKGLESTEGTEIIKKYTFGYESHRKYNLFKYYYTRFIWAVVLYVIYDQTRMHLEQSTLDDNIDRFEKTLEDVNRFLNKKDLAQSKEDILFETVLTNFIKKYSREPDSQELNLICAKVYATKKCPENLQVSEPLQLEWL